MKVKGRELTTTQELTFRLFRALGKPPRVNTDQWESIFQLILADGYKPEDLIAVIEWFPTNPHWVARIGDVHLFNESLPKLWQECRAARLAAPTKTGKIPLLCRDKYVAYGLRRCCHETAGFPFPCPTVDACGFCKCPMDRDAKCESTVEM